MRSSAPPPGKKVFLAWFWVGLCILAIFFVVAFARAIQKFVSAQWGRSFFGYTVLAVVAVAFVGLLYILLFRLKIRSPSNYIWLTAVAALYVSFTIKLWKIPEEAVHFLEYGLLGILLFRALSFSLKDKSIYFAGFLIGSLVGIIDEILQWITHDRYWDFRDVGINVLAGALIQVAIWKGIRPKIITGRVTPRSVKTVSILLAANIILLGLCLSNTPERVARYSEIIPVLSFLQKEETMHEFKTQPAGLDLHPLHPARIRYVGEKSVWGAILVFLAGLAAANVIFGRSFKR